MFYGLLSDIKSAGRVKNMLLPQLKALHRAFLYDTYPRLCSSSILLYNVIPPPIRIIFYAQTAQAEGAVRTNAQSLS